METRRRARLRLGTELGIMINRDLGSFSNETYDLVVVGGGIIGCGIARDASLRGLKTLLIDKEDFSYGTTSASTRLIHGGLRYLRQFEFGLVRMDMREREILLKIAPHLVSPLPFLIPMTSHLDRIVMAAGMVLYDLLSFDKSLPHFRYFSRKKTLEMEPDLKLENLKGSYRYYDCQIAFAERLCIENVLCAAEHGASIANHAMLTGVEKSENNIHQVQIKDTLSGKVYRISTRMVVNAAGPWMDLIHGMLGTNSKPMMRLTKGIHLLIPKISNNAIVLFAHADGRLFFVIPWKGYSLVGTTDTDYSDDADKVHADSKDVDYLMSELRRVFPDMKRENIYYSIAGLRALAGSSEGSASNVTRGHKLIDHEDVDGLKGFISVIGGKITGYRAIAREVTDLVCKKLGINIPCSTARIPLPGAPAVPQKMIEQAAKENNLPVETVSHLHSLYGSRLYQIIEISKKYERGKAPICPHTPDIIAQIWHATQEEGALTVSDFLLRRSATGHVSCQGLDAAETVAREMGDILKWSDSEIRRQVEEYGSYIAMSQRFRAETSNTG
jgi:glycerol-3-phosphate dehydrogenase